MTIAVPMFKISLMKKFGFARVTYSDSRPHLNEQSTTQTFSSFADFLTEKLNVESQWEVAISEKSEPSMHQKITERKFMFFDKKLPNSSKTDYLEPGGLYPSITEVFEAMNTQSQRVWLSKKVPWRKQEIEKYLANGGSRPAFFITDLGHVFGTNVGNEFGMMLRGIGPHKSEFGHNIVPIHPLMVYRDMSEYNTVGGTKPFGCVVFSSFQS